MSKFCVRCGGRFKRGFEGPCVLCRADDEMPTLTENDYFMMVIQDLMQDSGTVVITWELIRRYDMPTWMLGRSRSWNWLDKKAFN